jgi:hypothetical protein
MNDDPVVGTIELLQAQIREMERELVETKRTVNTLCKRIHRDPIYLNTEPSNTVAQRSDEFYGKPLASVVRTILERRQGSGLGAASIDAIFSAMKNGGFLFENAKNDGTAKRSLSVSLSKNTVTFHRLPNDDIGLLEWYPNAPQRTRGNGSKEKLPIDDDESYPNDFAETESANGEESEAASASAVKPK